MNPTALVRGQVIPPLAMQAQEAEAPTLCVEPFWSCLFNGKGTELSKKEGRPKGPLINSVRVPLILSWSQDLL